MINDSSSNVPFGLEWVLRMKFTPDLNWNSYIRRFAKDTRKLFGSLTAPPPQILESVGISLSLQDTDHPKNGELLQHRGWSCSNLTFQHWHCVQMRLRGLVGVDPFFPPFKPNPTNKTLLVSNYFVVISKDVWENIPWFHQSRLSELAPNMPRTLRRCIFITFIFFW